MRWKGRCRKTKDTRSIIARVACTLFARNMLWYVNTGGRDALMILYRRILSLDRASTLRRAMSMDEHIFGDLRGSEVGRRDIQRFCKRFPRERTGRKHVLVMPYIPRESTERVRSLALHVSLFRKEQEIFHRAFWSRFGVWSFCTGRRHDP